MKINLKKLTTFILVFSPVVAFAAEGPALPKNFSDIICIVVKLALSFIPYIVVIAVGAFLQGLIKYIGNGDNEEKRSEGRMLMIYGIVGLFFMVSFWGILKLFTNSFALPLGIPQFKEAGQESRGSCTLK